MTHKCSKKEKPYKIFQFKDGDMPVPADTLALIDLNINSHHCSRIIERIDKKFEFHIQHKQCQVHNRFC